MDDELFAHARGLAEANRYLTLGTVDAEGNPWTSPVYFAADDDLRTFYWLSREDCQHSRNVAVRPAVSLAVFDSSVRPYHGRCLYAVGTAGMCSTAELEAGLRTYPGPSERGGAPMTLPEVTGASPLRLFRMRANALWVLCPGEPGKACARHGRTDDHRERIG
jgi:nitroimidazol reductase NimA-like FMN-containing flavoprotein (pyridoxamine 5'-phosphate oxidase superfamily)